MRFEKIINTAYSFGAAVVVFGAWAKLGNKEYAEIALTAGLLTETGIFFIYGLLEWRQQPEPPSLPLTGEPPSWPPAGKPLSMSSTPADGAADASELTDTLRQTNRILQKVFKTE